MNHVDRAEQSMTMDSSRRRFVAAGLVSVGTVAGLAGCLGDDDDDVSVPDGEFTIIDREETDMPGGDDDTPGGSEFTVEYTGDELIPDNTHSIELRPAEGGLFDSWAPTTDDPISDGDTAQFLVGDDTVAPGEEVLFVWMSPDGELEAELNSEIMPQ